MKNYTITVNGTPYNVTVQEGTGAPVAAAPVAAPAAAPAPAATPAPAPAAAPAAPAAQGTAGSVKVEAPMPGTILDVAPQDGTVASINVSKSDSVEAGQVIITLN